MSTKSSFAPSPISSKLLAHPVSRSVLSFTCSDQIVLIIFVEIFGNQANSHQEAFDGSITLNDDHPIDVQEMLRFMYTFSYDYRTSSELGLPSELSLFNVRMYIMGDKYDVPALRREAAQKFEVEVRCSQLDGRISGYYAAAIKKIYSSVPSNDRTLIDKIVSKLADFSHIILDRTNDDTRPLRECLGLLPSFTSDLLLELSSQYHQVTCPGCGNRRVRKGAAFLDCQVCGRSNSWNGEWSTGW